jgi:hypothetical protein
MNLKQAFQPAAIVWTFCAVELYRKLYRELLESSTLTGFQTERVASTRRGLTVQL